MAKIVDKVNEVLKKAFPRAALVNVNYASWDADETGGSDSGRVIASVISDEFEGVDHLARQRIVWAPLKKGLSPSERSKIAIVVPSTPAEEEFAAAIKGL
jgi:acid stress-induced BolA-like protein IbaG/YrbA